MNSYQQYIHASRYARWIPEEQRRETWDETVSRYVSCLQEKHKGAVNFDSLHDRIKSMEIMPSMRMMMTAGKALERDNMAAFNCAYIHIDSVRSFDEMMYVLMCGTGVGFSVERQYISKLPEVAESFYETDTVIVVSDSKIGWAKAFKELLSMLYAGMIPKWDLSRIRPSGVRLKTFGGRASGPQPLEDLFRFAVELFQGVEHDPMSGAAGRKLTSIECHDLCCKIAEIVVVGGVRRCLPATTPVKMSDGTTKNIEDIVSGDMISCLGVNAKVLNSGYSGEKKLIGLVHMEGILTCTPHHKVAKYISDSEYEFVEASSIRVGDFIVYDNSDKLVAGEPEIMKALVYDLVEGTKAFPTYDIEVEGINRFTADNIVVHNSALLSLSNLSDQRMRDAKSGNWWEQNKQRALANNSVAYTEKPDIASFMQEWTSLMQSGSGERGIFYRGAANNLIPERRKELGYTEFGVNPCSEIVLRSAQVCNLTEVIVRADDTLETLKSKVRDATILGTLQASFTDFRYVRSIWKQNSEEEALLGVSLTGIMDHPIMSGSTFYGCTKYDDGEHDVLSCWLQELREEALKTNKKVAKKIGINPASAITCVKPSGTISQLVDSSSGIHPRFSEYYIRTVRSDNKDPLTQYLIEKGVPSEPDVTQPDTTTVFSFPIKSPEGAITASNLGAIQQLELWKTYQLNWCDHKPSITVYIKPDEWLEVGSWVYKNFEIVSGISFLPYSEHTYRQAPYQEIDQSLYEDMHQKMPDIDFTQYTEAEDNTTSSQELACVAGACEL